MSEAGTETVALYALRLAQFWRMFNILAGAGFQTANEVLTVKRGREYS